MRRLLPPELKDYYRNGMIYPENKDHLLQMSSCLIINLDEFDTLSPVRMQELKSLITQDVMNERKVYDIQNYTFTRRASFIASTNNPHCLPDIGENRRILFNTLLKIDYHTPVNHQGYMHKHTHSTGRDSNIGMRTKRLRFSTTATRRSAKRSDGRESFLLFPGCQAERYTGEMVSRLLPAVGIKRERAYTGQRTDETNAGHGTGEQPFPLTEDLQQCHRILGGGVYIPGTYRKFNTTASSGSKGLEL
ncbi:VapE family protein [Bacteroides sp. CR5/BHMF/2]|nr:VapE family protein [Bacteroides sp. CR5/BHMF/2]